MKRFFFTRKFNRVDFYTLPLAILLFSAHQWLAALGFIVVTAIISAVGEESLKTYQPEARE